MNLNLFVDTDHVVNKVTRRPHTGIIHYVNSAPIVWYSKRQNTVEALTFSFEFIALLIATNMNEVMRYKLRMLLCHYMVKPEYYVTKSR